MAGKRSRIRSWWLGLLGATVAVGSTVALAATAPQAQAAGQCAVTNANYQMCWTDGADSNTLLFQKAAERIAVAPAGSTIHVAMYQWHNLTNDPLFDALRQAVIDGKPVKVLLGNKSGVNDPAKDGAGAKIQGAVGAGNVFWCTAAQQNEACLQRSETSPGLMHAKFVLIKYPTGRTEVITFSSNITSGQYGRAQNSLAVFGDVALYDAYYGFWDRLVQKKWLGWTTDGDLGRDGSFGGNKAYFFPRAAGDPMASIIDGKHCAGDGEQIRILSSDDDLRPTMRTAIQKAKTRGCFIRITVTSETIKSAILNAPGNNLTGSNINVNGEVHSKVVYIRARTSASSALSEVVFTGSHNLGQYALRYADDVMVRTQEPTVTAAYRTYVMSFQS
ncbi:hypothetical protein GUY44_08385 [Pimelobacter simplex]|nr:phospholipase D-like domain-containing protein [Pimelobacter simplex]MCG8150493.1 hypothetical protein [Pimelobacter simplex]